MSTLVEEMASIIAARDYPGGYRWLRLAAAEAARAAQPGQYLEFAGRRWPLLRADPAQGWLDCLGRSDAAPAQGAALTLRGPLGSPFQLERASPRALLLGKVDGLASLLFLADRLRRQPTRIKTLLLLETGGELPFHPQPSRIIVPDLPSWVIAALPLCEDWGIASRLASPGGEAGCYNGPLTELARLWLDTLQGTADVTVYACGDAELLGQTRRLAERYRLAWQGATAV
ncbi:MAG TPA: dihydroorotate dehydrogenase electron transfer subunit [Candidatus Competibacteraceae bacterium]|nr:dihydroorotate dehydrogenase electron transfer subunit [Candidatus Competibacteraceae bacterium]